MLVLLLNISIAHKPLFENVTVEIVARGRRLKMMQMHTHNPPYFSGFAVHVMPLLLPVALPTCVQLSEAVEASKYTNIVPSLAMSS